MSRSGCESQFIPFFVGLSLDQTIKHNSVKNSARNIYKIANNDISKKERPTYLSRSKQVISDTSSVGKLQCHSTSLVEAT